MRPAIDRLAVLSCPELAGTAQVRSVDVVDGERRVEAGTTTGALL